MVSWEKLQIRACGVKGCRYVESHTAAPLSYCPAHGTILVTITVRR